jgi:transposase-like protein
MIKARWYVAYPLSTRHIEELMLERGVHVDHSTIIAHLAFHPIITHTDLQWPPSPSSMAW